MLFTYALLCLLPFLVSGQGEIGCFVSGQCEIGANGTVTTPLDADGCLDDCKNDPACLYFTYDTYADTCLHIGDCEGLIDTDRPNLYTGHASCDYLECGTHGQCDGHATGILTIGTVDECLNACIASSDCNWWTYADDGEELCFLFRDCPRVDKTCDYCLYGQSACEDVAKCPDGWDSYPGTSRCVKLFTDGAMYGNAEAACLTMGTNGNLVSIQSQLQQDFLEGIIDSISLYGNVWIGLNDLFIEGQFHWADGSPVNYTNWYNGEPNNQEMDEDATELLVFQSWQWNDRNVTFENPYICQVDRE